MAEKFTDKLTGIVDDHKHMTVGESAITRIKEVVSKVSSVTEMQVADSGANLNSEVVHEQEQEAEEEAEEEAEQEEQKISAFSRDDEQHNPWVVDILTKVPSCKLGGEEPFYRFNEFQVRKDTPTLKFPENLLLSDNFFRPSWVGLGDRRLKNVGIVLEWNPDAAAKQLRAILGNYCLYIYIKYIYIEI